MKNEWISSVGLTYKAVNVKNSQDLAWKAGESIIDYDEEHMGFKDKFVFV